MGGKTKISASVNDSGVWCLIGAVPVGSVMCGDPSPG